VVDTALAGVALAVGLSSDQNVLYGASDRPAALAVVDVALGVVCLAGVWIWRRSAPVAFALAAIAIGVVSTLGGGVALVCVFTVAARRPWRTAVAVGAVAALSIAPALWLYPVTHESRAVTVGALATFAATGWGMYVRARRELLTSLRRRLEDAEHAAGARAEAARRGERERIAREMHDVLAHRLSLLAVHAGGLEFHPGAPPEEVARIAGVIRSSTHQALDELREVISVLRDQHDDPRPQPTLADLPTLVEESRAAGLVVSCTVDPQLLSLGELAGTSTGRTVYRVVQEGLTNARKHAPGAQVTVDVTEDDDGIAVCVLSDGRPRPQGSAQAPDAPPGSGTGLIGLHERVGLAGGRIDHGLLDDGRFRVRAWLPQVALDRARA